MDVPFLSRLIFKVRHKVNKKKTNSPFMSGDSFKQICDLIIDNDVLDHQEIGKLIDRASVIFCRSNMVEEFIDQYRHRIKAKVLFCGNSDRDFIEPINFPSTLRLILLQNSFISDGKKILTLPIGLENQKLGINGLPRNFKSKPAQPRSMRVLIGPFSPTHQSRVGLIEKYLRISGPWTVLNKWIFPDRLIKMIERFSYVLAPRGNGADTHRVWETLYKGAFPIVEENDWSRSLVSEGFPLLLVPNLEPETVANFVAHHKAAFFQPQDLPQLWLPYWLEKVKTALELA